MHAENMSFSIFALSGTHISLLDMTQNTPLLSHGASNLIPNYIICTGGVGIMDIFVADYGISLNSREKDYIRPRITNIPTSAVYYRVHQNC